MKLTYDQKKQILENGFVKIPGVVPKIMIDEARRAVNHSVGEGMNVEDMPVFRQRSYAPELASQPVITDLVNKTPAFQLAECLIGEGMIEPITGGQIALRFPSLMDPPKPVRHHLDGMPSEHNGVPKNTYHNFTMLLGVILSDVPEPNSGNFTVWPGSHLSYEKYFKEHGSDVLLNGLPQVELREPVQITGQAGDIILCHYQIAHASNVNLSPNIRYACYFRLKHVDHEKHWKETYSNLWLDWPGIRELG
jgi:hypothetical protein